MSYILVSVLALACFSIGDAAKSLPDFLQRCKEDDPSTLDCVKEATIAALPHFVEGIQSLGIHSIDPLKVTSMDINQDKSGPVSVELKLTDESISGFGNMIIETVDGTAKLDNYHLKFKVMIPRFEMLGQYQLQGRVLLLPLTGSGDSNLTLVDMDVHVDIMGKPFEKKGDQYLDITDFKLDIQPKRLYMYFQNLLGTGGGDNAISSRMNDFLNENWSIIYAELKPSIEDTFGAILREVSNRLFSRVPFKNIALQDA